jgi:hypothetical protein
MMTHRTAVAYPVPPVPTASPVIIEQLSPHQQQQQSMEHAVPAPRAPQAILQSSVESTYFPSLGFTAGVSRRTRRSF